MSAGWVAENEALSDSGMDFNDLVTLKPRHVGAITELPRQLIQQSSPDINSLVRDDLAKNASQALELIASSRAFAAARLDARMKNPAPGCRIDSRQTHASPILAGKSDRRKRPST